MASLNISSLTRIEFGDTLKTHDNLHSITKLLVDKVNAIPKVDTLHLNIDLIVYICQSIENIVRDSKLKYIDKFTLFTSVYLQIYPDTTEKELMTVRGIVTYLNNGRLLAPISKTPSAVFVRRVKSLLGVAMSAVNITN